MRSECCQLPRDEAAWLVSQQQRQPAFDDGDGPDVVQTTPTMVATTRRRGTLRGAQDRGDDLVLNVTREHAVDTLHRALSLVVLAQEDRRERRDPVREGGSDECMDHESAGTSDPTPARR
jgi:hypothetical protein